MTLEGHGVEGLKKLQCCNLCYVCSSRKQAFQCCEYRLLTVL